MSDASLQEYADSLFGGEDDLLRSMRDEAEAAGLPLIHAPLQLGRLLQVLIVATGARRVLEVGTLFGYTAVLMAQQLPEDGKLTTLEVDPRHAEVARRNVDRAGLSARVEVLQGPAADLLDTLSGQIFDLIFIDANKDGYPVYLQKSLPLTHPGSVIVADNVWFEGAVLRPQEDEVSRGIAEFTHLLGSLPNLVTTFFATRDARDAATVSVVTSR